MDAKKLAQQLVPLVGGAENINSVIHCMTRLRFQLADKKTVRLSEIEALEGVMGVKEVGAQTQVIIGPNVASVYRQVQELIGSHAGGNTGRSTDSNPDRSVGENESMDRSGKACGRGENTRTKTDRTGDPVQSRNGSSVGAALLDMVSGIFAPVIPLITGAGMIKAILVIMVALGLSGSSREYYILSFIADCGFYFFPVVLAFSSAQKFHCNPYLAAMIGGVLIHPNWNALVSAGEPVHFFGIPVRLFSYGSSILPIILTVWFMSYVERFADKVSPSVVKAILKPLITMAVTSVVSLIVLAPLGSYIGSILSGGIAFLDKNIPVLVPTIVGGVQPLLVFFGMHLAIFPPLQTIQISQMGYETVCGPGFLAAVMACSGATFGFSVRSRDKKVKELGFSTGLTALCGVTEPAVYGIIVKYRQIIPAVVLGGVTGGFFAGVFHLKRYAIATPGIPALPTFVGEDGGNIFIAIGTVVIAFFVSAAAAFVIGGKDRQGEKGDEGHILYAPVSGQVIPLEKVPDETFASGVLGKGCAIIPSDPYICAPFDGTVIQTMDSGHALGISSVNGVEVLIHVGIDTVNMKGDGFRLLCYEGEEVRKGQQLLRFDPDTIRQAGYEDTTMVIVTNSDDHEGVILKEGDRVKGGDPLLIIKK